MTGQDDRSRPPSTAARPAVPLALAALSGVALAAACPLRAAAGAGALALALGAALVAALAAIAARPRPGRPADERGPAPARALALLLLAVALIGAARRLDARAELEAQATRLPPLPPHGARVMLKGRVLGRVARLPGGRALVPLEVESLVLENAWQLPGGFQVLARIPPGERRRAGDLLPGRRLEVEGRLATPAAAPLSPSGGEGGLLEREGLAAVLDATSVWRLESGVTSWPGALAARLARRVGQAIAQAELDAGSESVLRALLLGDRSRLAPDVRRAFVATGTIHLLVVAGLHVALLAGLLARWARAWPLPDLVRRAFVIALVVAYVALVGPRPGALRAGLGAILVVAGGASGRAGDAWNRLALAAILLLAWDPAGVGDAGFQLSFGTVAGILALGGLLADRRADDRATRARAPGAPGRAGWARRGARVLRSELASAAAAFVAHAPLAVAWFGQLSPVGILANVLALPLAALTLAPGALGAVLGAIDPSLGRPWFRLAGVAAGALVALVRRLASVPGASVSVAPPSPLATALSLGLVTLGLSLAARRTRARHGQLVVALGVLVWLAALMPGARPVEPGADGADELPAGREAPSVRLLVRPEAGGIVVELAVGESRPVPLDGAETSGDLPPDVRVERLGRASGAFEALRVEASGRAALVLGDLGGRDLAQLLALEPEGRLRASVLVASPRPSRALESLALRTRPLVLLVPVSRAASAVARRLTEAGLSPLELARVGPVEIELGESVSVRALR